MGLLDLRSVYSDCDYLRTFVTVLWIEVPAEVSLNDLNSVFVKIKSQEHDINLQNGSLKIPRLKEYYAQAYIFVYRSRTFSPTWLPRW